MKKKNLKYLLLVAFVFAIGAVIDFVFGGGGLSILGGSAGLAFAAITVDMTPGTPANGDGSSGKHISGGGLDTDITREAVPGLIRDKFDEEVTKMGFSSSPINALTRDIGSKKINSMRYGYYSVDLRRLKGTTAGESAISISTAEANRAQPTRKTIKLTDNSILDKTDQIFFNVSGYNEDNVATPYVKLAARVCEVGDNNTATVQFLNASTSEATSIPVGTAFYVLGHAASETDASTVPNSALPEELTQYMQKFMVQSVISNVMIESNKEVKWEESDVYAMATQQLLEDIEKHYIFSAKSYTYDSTTRLYTYTTSGIIEQIVNNGGHVIEENLSTFSDNKIVDMTSEIFTGNSGSTTRYMYGGNDFLSAFFKLPSVYKQQNVNDVARKFEYDFKRIRLMSYTLLQRNHPLLDKMDMGNCALIIDPMYIQRRFFRSTEDTELKMKETGLYDGKSRVLCEISSVILKYPQCHALIVLDMDN